jgi:hypothetical protein
MNNELRFRRITAISAIVSGPLAFGASLTILLSFGADPEIISSPTNMISQGEDVAAIFRVAEFVGMFGYYLLFIPLIFYLWSWLKSRNHELVTTYTIVGFGSIFIGVIASTIFITVVPPIMEAYAVATETQSEVLGIVFGSFFDLAFTGLLGLSAILSGMWKLGMGLHLRAEFQALGIATIILGIISLGYGVGAMLQIPPLAALEAGTFFGPIWAVWFGIVVLRRVGQIEQSEIGLVPA